MKILENVGNAMSVCVVALMDATIWACAAELVENMEVMHRQM